MKIGNKTITSIYTNRGGGGNTLINAIYTKRNGVLVKLWPSETDCEHTFSSTSYSAHNKDSTGYYLVCNKCNEKVYCTNIGYTSGGYYSSDCTKGSNGGDFCRDHNVQVSFDGASGAYSEHDFSVLLSEGRSGSCSHSGITPTYQCSRCSQTDGGISTGLDESNHEGPFTTSEGTDPTCTTIGTTGSTYCNACAQRVSGSTIIDPLGHNWLVNVQINYNGTPAVITGIPVHSATCDRCGVVSNITVSYSGPNWTGTIDNDGTSVGGSI